ncbi:hypothetical protein [Faecalibacter bovis]|uniref:ABC transporter ATP-binding protein n=1 Tax=Faecalibacter bovis TaxID=2898187 RepID=A0ABX7XAD7_9FLAO|nr:hypothetical protein [Faecalibacter bovis]QTV04855.1 hypothetical protein J9309_08595 [Faecalibacter bovis]
MSKGILILIKIIMTFIVIAGIVVLKAAGLPIIIVNIIGIAIIYAVWRYKPSNDNDENFDSNQTLNKN